MQASESPTAQKDWFRSYGTRLIRFWPAKLFGISAGMGLFFFAYFWILHHPLRPPVVMPSMAIDRAIGFWPGALPLYFSLWIYISLAPALLDSCRLLINYAVWAVALALVALGIFIVWPTTIAVESNDWTRYPAYAFLKTIDASGNACPSLHVAFAIFSAVWLVRTLKEMAAPRAVLVINWLWCVGILYSTLATRQHVFLDVVAGAALGLIASILSKRRNLVGD